MSVVSEIKHPEYVMLDKCDWDALCSRMMKLEEDVQRIQATMVLLMQGVKERLDEQRNYLLSRLENTVARKDLG